MTYYTYEPRVRAVQLQLESFLSDLMQYTRVLSSHPMFQMAGVNIRVQCIVDVTRGHNFA